MLLPELTIPVSFEIFDTNFEYFFLDFVSKKDSPKFTFTKRNISYKGHRYSIYLQDEKPEITQQILLGEIDVIKVDLNRVYVRAAVYHIQDYTIGLRFFDIFYFMVFSKWEIPFSVESLNCKRGEGATMEWVNIGWDTGYFCLPEVFPEMFESENEYYDDFLKYAPSDLEIYSYLPEVVCEEIRQIYELQINQGLPNDLAIEKIVENSEGDNRQISDIIEKIQDNNLDRIILRRWLEGAKAKKIGREIERADRTVYNTLTRLRGKYGREIVPRNEDRIKK